MSKLTDKIKTALDESRMLILGTQIFLGFQYRAVFEKGFEALPRSSQQLKLAALGVMLVAVALLMWPGAYHRIVRAGNDATDVHDFTSAVMDIALLPITIVFALEFYVLSARVWGMAGGVVAGATMGAIALFFGTAWELWVFEGNNQPAQEKHQIKRTRRKWRRHRLTPRLTRCLPKRA
ncbi:MAG: DUF6328 family protein [Pyrinomonadaceae bacterium]